jgi:SAM-dependent methyltransferase
LDPSPRSLSDSDYVLGHAERELERLVSQGRFYEELTEQHLRRAGLTAGMHVLDAGCGAGDVSLIAARIVGPSGTVTGVDRASEALALAGRRCSAANLAHVRFCTGALETFEPEAPLDAVIGRLVLLYVPDPPSVLRRLARFVRPGGIVTFQEFDMSRAESVPPCPLVQRAIGWICEAFTRAGLDIRLGLRLGAHFESAGLRDPKSILATRVERGRDSPGYDQIAQVVETLLPVIEKTGVATAQEVDLPTFAARLREETVRLGGSIVFPGLVSTWARVS